MNSGCPSCLNVIRSFIVKRPFCGHQDFWHFNLLNTLWPINARDLTIHMIIPHKFCLWVLSRLTFSFNLIKIIFISQDLSTCFKISVLVTLVAFGDGPYLGYLCFTNTNCLALFINKILAFRDPTQLCSFSWRTDSYMYINTNPTNWY